MANEVRYSFVLTGTKPLLMHADDVVWAQEIDTWRMHPDNTQKKGEKKGDDRRPPWTWVGYCYTDRLEATVKKRPTHLSMPADNLTSCLKSAGARVPLKGTKTFKELAVSGILFDDDCLEFLIPDPKSKDGKMVQVPWAPIAALATRPVKDFLEHVKVAEDLGFELLVKRAPIGMSKHVRVRPQFKEWLVRGTLTVFDERISFAVLNQIFHEAGRLGLGDWRPGSPKSPGRKGMFTHTLKAVK